MKLYSPASDLLKEEFTEEMFLLEPYIPINSRIVLYGDSSLGKSAIMWQMADAIQENKTLWGLPTQQANVLVLELDTPPELVQRRWRDAQPKFEPTFDIVFEQMGIDCLQFLSNYPDDRHKKLKDAWQEAHAKRKYGLVCVDAMVEVVNGDLNRSGLFRKIYDAFHKTFPGASPFFLHHIRKAQTAFGPEPSRLDLASGNKELTNTAQVAMWLHKTKNDLFLTHAKTQASVRFPPLALTPTDDDYMYFDGKEKTRQESVLKIMLDPQNAQLSKRELDILIGKQFNCSPRTVRTIRSGILQQQAIKPKA